MGKEVCNATEQDTDRTYVANQKDKTEVEAVLGRYYQKRAGPQLMHSSSFIVFGRHTDSNQSTAAIFLTPASLSKNDLSRFVVIIS